jgi:hypothetical protein
MSGLMTYWRLESLEAAAGGPLGYTASNWFGRLRTTPKPGDRVFVVSERSRRMLLMGALVVDELLSTEQAELLHPGFRLWDSDWHIFAVPPYDEVRADLVVAARDARAVRTITGDSLALERRHYELRRMALNTNRWLDDASVRLFERLLDDGRGSNRIGRARRPEQGDGSRERGRGTQALGLPYRPADVNFRTRDLLPFTYDPDARDRQTRAHYRVQELAATVVRELGFEALSPSPTDPQFDLAFVDGHRVTVIEVKSLPAKHADAQLRLGLGQVLEYAARLDTAPGATRAVLLVERRRLPISQKCET